ncbi:acyloxyacyl hydrolase [Jhaorihella thermophila]|uniref:Lipid A 3-O-deacylase (PagL) n=1 Tax=Jhaorihella thermophila TaxID=488547 RepID=A0A1H5X863_9RHOB|nr:acyloxyacyl hydrolase [Jhaorihella thermophila]SEG07823.1 Lipid A 3-O-deacylase (PagL) [Jhaorihella thermophila]
MAGKLIRRFVSALAMTIMAAPVAAQQWVVGAGWSDYSYARADDSIIGTFEYHAAPFYVGANAEAGWALSGEVTGAGDGFVGGGAYLTYDLGPAWFLEASVMPGAFFEKPPVNDLGSTFEIRSLLGLGYRFGNGSALSLAVSHKSNASTSNFNPGANSIFLRWHWGM